MLPVFSQHTSNLSKLENASNQRNTRLKQTGAAPGSTPREKSLICWFSAAQFPRLQIDLCPRRYISEQPHSRQTGPAAHHPCCQITAGLDTAKQHTWICCNVSTVLTPTARGSRCTVQQHAHRHRNPSCSSQGTGWADRSRFRLEITFLSYSIICTFNSK